MGRWMGIDPGTKRIGVAVGTAADGIACPVAVIAAEPADQAVRRIEQLAAEYAVVGVVVGWPLNMNGSEGPQARAARSMAQEVASGTDLEVRLWDERLSSFAADEALAGMLTRRKRRARQDAVAAAAMLQDFLSAGGAESAPRPDQAEQGK